MGVPPLVLWSTASGESLSAWHVSTAYLVGAAVGRALGAALGSEDGGAD